MAIPSCNWLGPVVTRFRPRHNRKEVWLTIDDGPAGEASVKLGEEMERRGVRATFFVKGENLARAAGNRTGAAGGGSYAGEPYADASRAYFLVALARDAAAGNRCLQRSAARGGGGDAALVSLSRGAEAPPPSTRSRAPRHASRRVECARARWTGVRSGSRGAADRRQAFRRERSFCCTRAGNAAMKPSSASWTNFRARGFSFVIPDDDQLI